MNGHVLLLNKRRRKLSRRLSKAWGHSVTALVDALPENVRPIHLRDKALELDQAYIPSRIPNVHPVGFPGDLYTKTVAERLIGYAKEIVEYCENRLQKARGREH